jgi:CubicO group peptidase (beta-lactamase class C family)
LVLVACAGAEGPAPYAELETYIQSEISDAGIVGLGAALIKDDRVEWTGAFGYANLKTRRETDVHTPFLVASISKTLVATLSMQLAEEGKLDLDRDIGEILGFPVRHPDHPDRSLTARMLATHTSGIIDDFIDLGQVSTNGVDSEVTLAEFAETYTSVPAHFGRRPGTRRVYSNSGFGVLGAVVEAAAGEPMPELAIRRIFQPIGMNDTGWLLREMQTEQLAVPYSGKRQEGAVASDHQGFAFYPATSLRTSIIDLSNYLLSFMRFGRTDSGARILSEESARAMREIQFPEIDDTQAYSWYFDSVAEQTYLGHTGSAIGFSAVMFFDPVKNAGFIVITNSDAFIRSRLGEKSMSEAIYRIAARLASEG